MPTACIETSPDLKFCKLHSGVLYLDDFTTPIAGRWTIIENGGSGEGWQIVDKTGELNSDWYETVFGTKCLRVRHDTDDYVLRLRIMNDEFPNPYVLDSLGRDYPWFSVRVGAEAVTPVPVPGWPDGFPYDWAWGGMEHKIQLDTDDRLSVIHTHQCGIFSTWVFEYFYVDGAYVSQSMLVNLMYNFWYLKHHLTPDPSLYITQGKPEGWSFGTDSWSPDPGDIKYGQNNGKFGLISAQCSAAWADPSYLFFHGLIVCETNYVTVLNIPPEPQGENAIPGLPEGVWMLKLENPDVTAGLGGTDTTVTYPNGSPTAYISFDDNNYGWRKVQIYVSPGVGNMIPTDWTLVAEFAPSDYVNGGDIYGFSITGEVDDDFPDFEVPEDEDICPIYPAVSSFDECEGGVWPDEINICPTT